MIARLLARTVIHVLSASASCRGGGRDTGTRAPILLFGAVTSLSLLALVLAIPASATQLQHPFKEPLGSAEQPSFAAADAIAVDSSTGDVLVMEKGNNSSIQRFHSDGTPAPFAALGANRIDGKGGAKPCAEEPASCDQTPEGGLQEGVLAIDDSGGPTDGNIYVTQRSARVVDIFSAEGKYLGQLTSADGQAFEFGPEGVAVGPTGVIYIASCFRIGAGQVCGIGKYVPTANPPTNNDSTAIWDVGFNGHAAIEVEVGVGASAGWLFAAASDWVAKVNEDTGENHLFSEELGSPIAVDAATGNLLAEKDTNPYIAWEAGEFDGAAETAGPDLSRLILEEDQGSEATGLAFGGSGNVYVSYVKLGRPPVHVRVYGQRAIVPTVTVDPATNVTGSRATLAGVVNPENLAVSECFFEYGSPAFEGNIKFDSKVPCVGSIDPDSGDHPVHATISGLTPNGSEYGFRLVAKSENGTEYSPTMRFQTAHTSTTEAATAIGRNGATLHGTILPEGLEYSQCFFEWGVNGRPFDHKVSCSPPAATIEPIFAPQPVKALLSGLEQNTTYRYRLVATNSEGTQEGREFQLTTLGLPQLSEIRASFAEQSSVALEAKVNPSGFGTSYHFDWGLSRAYGNSTPASFSLFAGSGTEPVSGTVKLTGLAPGTVYHYRIVATNSAGTESSGDRTFETLGRCGLPEQRCFELVSPRQLGPIAAPGRSTGGIELLFQASPSSAGALAYTIEGGLPEATRGGNVLYLGRRNSGVGAWESTQFSAPIVAPDEKQTSASPSYVFALSPDLRCGVVASSQPLTSDPAGRQVIEAGGANLYRRNPDGSYDLITYLPPTNLEAIDGGNTFENYRRMVGLSDDCSRVIFESDLHYPGTGGIGEWRLYEWNEGALHDLARVPAGSGEAPAEVFSEAARVANHLNALSADGSKVFFTAKRLTGANPGEVGKNGVFARIGGAMTVDVSASETTAADTGAKYQGATPDGSRVYFTANAGLTAQSSSSGTDLYAYDFTKPLGERLTDLSVSSEPGGAEVGGVLGFADDGSHVYLAARAQLLPGRGATREQNVDDDTYSVYDWSGGAIRFVGAVTAAEVRSGGAAVAGGQGGSLLWRSRVSPDGRYLLFETSAKVTGYDSQGQLEAYLYDADAGATACVSCRQDGKPPIWRGGPLDPLAQPANLLSAPASLVVDGEEARAFFVSKERLAAGAVQGAGNLYEWAHGQVFHIATEPVGGRPEQSTGISINFVGASADGSDLYFFAGGALNWENPEGRPAVWDARIGGGFPEPLASPEGCDPASEGSCQGASTPPLVASRAGTASFHGPGNVRPRVKHRKRHHKTQRRHKKKHAKGKMHRKGKKHRKGKRARHASGNRRAGK